MALVFLCVLTAVLGYCAWFHRHRMAPLLAAAAKCPGPPTLPFIGNATYFLGDTDNIFNKLERLLLKYPTDQMPARVWLGTRLLFFVTAPDHIQRTLNAPESMGKDDSYDFARSWVGEGLLTSPVAKWKRHRHVMMPAFNQRVLDAFFPVFVEQNRQLVRQLNSVADGRIFDCFHFIVRCNLDIVCETSMGVELGAQGAGDKALEYVNAAESQLMIIAMRMIKVWLRHPLIFRLSGWKRQENDNIRVLHNFSQQIVEKRTQKNKEEKKDRDGRKSFLDIIIANTQKEDEKSWSDQELREEVDTLIAAGTDTTAAEVSFILMVLGMHPDIQDKVFAELCDICGSERREIRLEDLSRMKYMEMVIREVMRLYPVGPFIVRHVSSDLKLTDKLTLPAGSGVLIGIRRVQSDPRYWGPDAHKFRPERFQPGQGPGILPYTYLPFAAGPRNCIGQRYGMMAMKVMVASVLQNFRVGCDCTLDNLPLKIDIIMRPIHGFNLSLRPRNKN